MKNFFKQKNRMRYKIYCNTQNLNLPPQSKKSIFLNSNDFCTLQLSNTCCCSIGFYFCSLVTRSPVHTGNLLENPAFKVFKIKKNCVKVKEVGKCSNKIWKKSTTKKLSQKTGLNL